MSRSREELDYESRNSDRGIFCNVPLLADATSGRVWSRDWVNCYGESVIALSRLTCDWIVILTMMELIKSRRENSLNVAWNDGF